MAINRDFKSLGPFAKTAVDPVASPVKGVAYRNSALTPAQNEVGWQYDTKPDSADINQSIYNVSLFTDEIDSRGVPRFSTATDYNQEVGIVWGSDGSLFRWLQESGPNTIAGVKDPVTEPTYWAEVLDAQDYSNELEGSEGSLLVGYTGKTVKAAIDDVQTEIDNLSLLKVKAKCRLIDFNNTFVGGVNVSSVVRNATGIYTVNFAIPLADANYTPVVSLASDTFGISAATSDYSTNSVRINIRTGASGGPRANINWSLIVL